MQKQLEITRNVKKSYVLRFSAHYKQTRLPQHLTRWIRPNGHMGAGATRQPVREKAGPERAKQPEASAQRGVGCRISPPSLSLSLLHTITRTAAGVLYCPPCWRCHCRLHFKRPPPRRARRPTVYQRTTGARGVAWEFLGVYILQTIHTYDTSVMWVVIYIFLLTKLKGDWRQHPRLKIFSYIFGKPKTNLKVVPFMRISSKAWANTPFEAYFCWDYVEYSFVHTYTRLF